MFLITSSIDLSFSYRLLQNVSCAQKRERSKDVKRLYFDFCESVSFRSGKTICQYFIKTEMDAEFEKYNSL